MAAARRQGKIRYISRELTLNKLDVCLEDKLASLPGIAIINPFPEGRAIPGTPGGETSREFPFSSPSKWVSEGPATRWGLASGVAAARREVCLPILLKQPCADRNTSEPAL